MIETIVFAILSAMGIVPTWSFIICLSECFARIAIYTRIYSKVKKKLDGRKEDNDNLQKMLDRSNRILDRITDRLDITITPSWVLTAHSDYNIDEEDDMEVINFLNGKGRNFSKEN